MAIVTPLRKPFIKCKDILIKISSHKNAKLKMPNIAMKRIFTLTLLVYCRNVLKKHNYVYLLIHYNKCESSNFLTQARQNVSKYFYAAKNVQSRIIEMLTGDLYRVFKGMYFGL